MTKRHHPLRPNRSPLAAGLALMLLGSVSAEAWAARPGADSLGERSAQAKRYDDREARDGGSSRLKLSTQPTVYDKRVADLRQKIKARQAQAQSEVDAAHKRQTKAVAERTDDNAAPDHRILSVSPSQHSGPEIRESHRHDTIRSSPALKHPLARVRLIQERRAAAEVQAQAITNLQKLPQRRSDNAPAPVPRKPPRGPTSPTELERGPVVSIRSATGLAPKLASKDSRRSSLLSTASTCDSDASPGAGSRKVEKIVAPQPAKLGPKPRQLEQGKRYARLYELPEHRKTVRNELVQAIEKRRNQALAQRDTHLRGGAPMQGLAKSRHAVASRGHAHLSHGANPLNRQMPGVPGSGAATTPRASPAVTGQRTQAYSAPQAHESSNASCLDHDPAPAATWQMPAAEALSLVYQVSGLHSIEHDLGELAAQAAPSLSLNDAWARVTADDRQSVHLEIDPTQSRWHEEVFCWRELFADLAIKPVVRFKQPITLTQLPRGDTIAAALVRIADHDGNPAAYAVVRRATDDTHWESLTLAPMQPGDGGEPTVTARPIDESALGFVELVVYPPLPIAAL